MSLLSAIHHKFLLVLLIVTLTGCVASSKPFVYTPADDPQPGPGLFSGPEGEFTIYQAKNEDK